MTDFVRILRELNRLNGINKIDIIHVYNIGRFMISTPSKILLRKKMVSYILGPTEQSNYFIRDTFFKNFIDAYMCGRARIGGILEQVDGCKGAFLFEAGNHRELAKNNGLR